jgi:hypothetical protein
VGLKALPVIQESRLEMSVSERAAALAPYAERLLDNRDFHEAIQRAASAGRATYERARGTTPAKAIKDKRLRRRFQQTAQASWDVWTAVVEPAPARRRRRWRRRIALVTVAAAGAFVALNAEARETVLGLVTSNDANSSNSSQ